jgi:hypothetical protein
MPSKLSKSNTFTIGNRRQRMATMEGGGSDTMGRELPGKIN